MPKDISQNRKDVKFNSLRTEWEEEEGGRVSAKWVPTDDYAEAGDVSLFMLRQLVMFNWGILVKLVMRPI